MKNLVKTVAVALLAGLASVADAGDYHHYTSLGFSADGKYYAFMQEGEQDGSGHYFVSVDVVDVETNRLLESEYSDAWTEFAQDGVDEDEFYQNQEKYIPKLKELIKRRTRVAQYGIDGKTQGDLRLSRQPTDFSEYTSSKFSTYITPFGGAVPNPDIYTLNLTSTKSETNDEWCWDGEYLLKLTVTKDAYYGEKYGTLVLQEDQRLPRSRRCAYDYSIKEVYELNDKVVVSIQYKTIGFEGPNYQFMVVTGDLKDIPQPQN